MVDIFGDDFDHTLQELVDLIFDERVVQNIIDIGYGEIYLSILNLLYNEIDKKK